MACLKQPPPPTKLAFIATAAGAFSGLFGVGGGAVIVPLLILWLKYEEREATGTSLAAIPLIAAISAAVKGGHGNEHGAEGQPHHANVLAAECILVCASAIRAAIPRAPPHERVPVRFLHDAFSCVA